MSRLTATALRFAVLEPLSVPATAVTLPAVFETHNVNFCIGGQIVGGNSMTRIKPGAS